jgi:hypothetical protein
MLSNNEIKEKFVIKINKLLEDLSTKPIPMLFERVTSPNLLEACDDSGEIVKLLFTSRLSKEIYKFFFKRHDILVPQTKDGYREYELMVGTIVYKLCQHIKPTESMLRDKLTCSMEISLPSSQELETNPSAVEEYRATILSVYGRICQLAPYDIKYFNLRQCIVDMYAQYFEKHAKNIKRDLFKVLNDYFTKLDQDEELKLAARGYVKIGEVKSGHKIFIEDPFKDPMKDMLDYFNSPEYKEVMEQEFQKMLDSLPKLTNKDTQQVLKDASDKTIENHKKEAQKELLNDLIGYLQDKLDKLN